MSDESGKDGGHSERPRILIVDDIPANIKSLNAILADDYNVIFATDWRKGLELAGRMSPDIVLLDIMMPDMDGYEICRRLKSESETREIPVIFITALDSEADEEKGLSYGAADYITKPFRPAIVRLRVRNHLQLKLQRDRLESLTMTDGMTEIANRRRFDQHLDEEWRRCARMHIPLSAIMMDIDHFKNVNDTYGHDAGDIVLRETAAVMKKCLRITDVICRFGGEEFLAICPGADMEMAKILGNRIRAAVQNNQVEADEFKGSVTISVGVAPRIAETTSPKQLIKDADEALYAAKEAGRNKVCIVTSG
ncbi:MAG: diguanylate cyclase [Alphaproteobacteria bacterium]|nr:diguanylate cyclase [Alphaproteobacteria bacterium]